MNYIDSDGRWRSEIEHHARNYPADYPGRRGESWMDILWRGRNMVAVFPNDKWIHCIHACEAGKVDYDRTEAALNLREIYTACTKETGGFDYEFPFHLDFAFTSSEIHDMMVNYYGLHGAREGLNCSELCRPLAGKDSFPVWFEEQTGVMPEQFPGGPFRIEDVSE